MQAQICSNVNAPRLLAKLNCDSENVYRITYAFPLADILTEHLPISLPASPAFTIENALRGVRDEEFGCVSVLFKNALQSAGWRGVELLWPEYKSRTKSSVLSNVKSIRFQDAEIQQDLQRTIESSVKTCSEDFVGNTQNEDDENCVDVLILGAGLAGLGCATVLKEKLGCKGRFRILEAQPRAGGRVHTIELQHNLLVANANDLGTDRLTELRADAGAQWLHGKYNYLYDMAAKFDLLSEVQSEEGEGIYFRPGGIEIDDFFVKKVDMIIGRILEECEEFARCDLLNSYPQSVEHFMREKFAIYLDTLESVEDRFLAERLLDWHIRFQIIDNSCMRLSDVSARDWGNYSFNGEASQAHYNFHSGFHTVIDTLVNEVGANKILFEKEVTSIIVLDQCEKWQIRATMATDRGAVNDDRRHRISVKCSDGSIYYANHVLVTFSLGVLKDCHRTMFEPRLPLRIENAICDIGYETINKLYIQFDEAWWGDADGIQLLFDEVDGDQKQQKHWTHWISGFDVMKTAPENTLLGWIGGPGAVEMECMNDQEIIDDCLALLKRFTNVTVPPPIRYHL